MGYYHNAAWRKLRLMQLRRFPLCAHCLERDHLELAIEVDHIIPRDEGGPDSLSNLQSLCKFHHGRKTRRENAKNDMDGLHTKDGVRTKDAIHTDREVKMGGWGC